MEKLLFIPPNYLGDAQIDLYNGFSEHYECLYYKDKNIALDFSPDIIYTQSGSIGPEILKEIKDKSGSFVIQWTGDCRDNEFLPEVINNKGISDLTLLASGKAQKGMYEPILGHPVEYLQHGVEENYYREAKYLENGKTVLICNAYDHFPGGAERNGLAEMLTRKYNDFEVWGSGFNNPPYNSKGFTPFSTTFDIYNNSYIAISCNIYNHIEGYHSDRFYFIMMAGCCCVARYTPGIEEYFEDGKDCLFYKTNEEALEKIEYLYNNPDIRNKIAKSGQEVVKKYHTNSHRVKEIKNILGKYR